MNIHTVAIRLIFLFIFSQAAFAKMRKLSSGILKSILIYRTYSGVNGLLSTEMAEISHFGNITSHEDLQRQNIFDHH